MDLPKELRNGAIPGNHHFLAVNCSKAKFDLSHDLGLSSDLWIIDEGTVLAIRLNCMIRHYVCRYAYRQVSCGGILEALDDCRLSASISTEAVTVFQRPTYPTIRVSGV